MTPMKALSRIDNREINDLIALSSELDFTQSQVAGHLKISANYWYQIRYGRMPYGEELIERVKELKKKLRDFAA